MRIALLILAGLAVLFLLAFVLAGRSRHRIASGRFARFARITRMGTRLWTSSLVARLRRRFTSKERRARYDEKRRQADAEQVARTMGQMKGAFMKIGQLLSFISDSIPPEYRAALEHLQTSAPPMDFALLRDIAERELGKPLERAFASIDTEPLASASIGQVHRARLPSGEEVAVKIQYPGVAEAIRADLDNAAMFNRMVKGFFPELEAEALVDEIRSRVFEELDYVREADNQRAFCDLYDGHPYIRVPRVIDSHSTSRVLTTEYVSGRRFEEIVGDDEDARYRWGEILYRFAIGSILRYGVFNGDPHPGNYIFDDRGRVVFLDFGCVKFFPEAMLQTWWKLVDSHLTGKPERFRSLAVDLGFIKEDSELGEALLYDYFGYYYEPFHDDRDYTFTREYNSKALLMVMRPQGRFAGMEKKMNMPRDFVLVNRIHWGVFSLLANLEARANWHRIHDEYLYGEPPETELGKLDRAHHEAWLESRGIEPNARVLLRKDGIRVRDPIQRSMPEAAEATASEVAEA